MKKYTSKRLAEAKRRLRELKAQQMVGIGLKEYLAKEEEDNEKYQKKKRESYEEI